MRRLGLALAPWVVACSSATATEPVTIESAVAGDVVETQSVTVKTVASAAAEPKVNPESDPESDPEADPEADPETDPWAGCTRDVDALPTAPGASARDDRRLREGRVLVAHKSARRLMLFDAGTLEACWRIGLGFSPTGHKEIEGDGRTPEGWYRTSDKPWSTFDGAIAIHYPATRDAESALDTGRISRAQRNAIANANRQGKVPPQRTPMGGAVLIHGGGSSSDWTLGCIALEDEDLADLRSKLAHGMRAHLMVVP